MRREHLVIKARNQKRGSVNTVIRWLWIPWLLASLTASAGESPASTRMVGAKFQLAVQPGDSLASLSAFYGEARKILAADNRLKESNRLLHGQRLSFDNRHIVPPGVNEGIMINIPQRMLFLLRSGRVKKAFPLGLGKPDWHTPTGPFTIASMQPDKTWIVPESIQEEMRQQGKEPIQNVPPGPANPLGKYWIGLSLRNIGIHGTNAPLSVYQFSSHGCVRLHPDDIAALYDEVTVGDPGTIVYQTVLLARLPDGHIFLEVNPDIYQRQPDSLNIARQAAKAAGLSGQIDWARAARVVELKDGIAREIGRGKDTPAGRTDLAKF
jgi:L,D-transpeptidase ErfK/SrfK